jgi:hypothetical protein
MFRPILLAAFNPLDYPAWLIPAVGVACAGVTLVLCRALFGRRVPSSPPAPTPAQVTAKETKTRQDPFVYGSALERRLALRRGGNPVEVLLSDAGATQEPVKGWVLDRSVGGLCLMVAGQIKPGTVLSVRAVNAPVTAHWVQIEVKCARDVEGTWELGCQFLKTPPWNIMLLFG